MSRPVSRVLDDVVAYYLKLLKEGNAAQKAKAARELTKIEVARLSHAKTAKIHRANAAPVEPSLADDPEPMRDLYARGSEYHEWEKKHDAWLKRHPDAKKSTPSPAPVYLPLSAPNPAPALAPVAPEPAPEPTTMPEDFTKMSSEERQERIRVLKEERARLQKLTSLTESAA